MLTIIMAAALGAASKVDCNNAVTNSDMLHCAALDLKKEEVALARQLVATEAAMKARDGADSAPADKGGGYQAKLLQEQKLWTQFRDAHCTVEGYSARGGSMEPLIRTGCATQMTRERSKQLRDLIKLYED